MLTRINVKNCGCVESRVQLGLFILDFHCRVVFKDRLHQGKDFLKDTSLGVITDLTSFRYMLQSLNWRAVLVN